MKRLVPYGLVIVGLAVAGWVIGSTFFDCGNGAGDCGIGAAWAINGAYTGVGVAVAACGSYEVFRHLNRRHTSHPNEPR